MNTLLFLFPDKMYLYQALNHYSPNNTYGTGLISISVNNDCVAPRALVRIVIPIVAILVAITIV